MKRFKARIQLIGDYPDYPQKGKKKTLGAIPTGLPYCTLDAKSTASFFAEVSLTSKVGSVTGRRSAEN